MTYGLQFILSLVIANRFGPYYMGVYGLVQLILSYFDQINFGIPHSLNVLLVHNKSSQQKQNEYIWNSMAFFHAINLLVVLLAVFFFLFGELEWDGFSIKPFFWLIILIAITSYYNSIVSTVIRFKNKVNLLSLIGSLPVLINIIVVFFFSESALVFALICSNLISCVITFVIGAKYINISSSFKNHFSLDIQKTIINKGLFLFLYNSCFYFIFIAIRTIISGGYSIEEFGFFTFSYTISNSVLLLLGSLNTIIFPKTIDMLSGHDRLEQNTVLKKLRVGYITSSHLLIYLAMVCYPLLIIVMPKYQLALTSLNLISLTILMNTNSYGYSTLLIAQNKERVCSNISFVALLITIILGAFASGYLHLRFDYVILSVLIAYLFISVMSMYEGDKLLGVCDASILHSLIHFMPIRLLIPYILALVYSLSQIPYLSFLPLIVFLILNYKDLVFLKDIVAKMIVNPNVIDVK